MWKCTVCNKENQDSVLRCPCGFDRRIDYEGLRTFSTLDAQVIQNYHKMKTSAQEAMQRTLRMLYPREQVQPVNP